MNDNDVLDMVKDSLSGIRMHSPVEAIVASGRSRRRRRLSGLALAGVAAGVGLTLGVPALTSRSTTAPPPAGAGQVHVHLAAFSVDSKPDGTVAVTLPKAQTADPDALRHALGQAGVPAVINVGQFCYGTRGGLRYGTSPGLGRVISDRRLADGTHVLAIQPGAMPAGSRLSIGILPGAKPGNGHRVAFALVTGDGPMTCTSTPPGLGTSAPAVRLGHS